MEFQETTGNMDLELKATVDVRCEQDRFLPIANIGRIMKKVLPDNVKITKESKECMQECVSEFISFITSEASDKCSDEKRKTVNGDDIVWSLNTLGFDNYVNPLKLYLSKYREACKPEKPEKMLKMADLIESTENHNYIESIDSAPDIESSQQKHE